MSWRSGSSLFLEMWPLLKKHIPDEALRADFASKLIKLFSDSDMDPMDLADVDAELDHLIGHESSEDSPEESVRICIKELKSSDPDRRNTAAEAICHFVGYAGGGSLAQDAATALAEVTHPDQPDEFLILALKSLRDLVWEDNAKIDLDTILPLLTSPNSEVAERAHYVTKGLNR